MKNLKILLLILLPTYAIGQINTNTNFNPAISAPIDVRDTLTTLNDTLGVDYKFPGLWTYVVDIDKFYYYNGYSFTEFEQGSAGSGVVDNSADFVSLNSGDTVAVNSAVGRRGNTIADIVASVDIPAVKDSVQGRSKQSYFRAKSFNQNAYNEIQWDVEDDQVMIVTLTSDATLINPINAVKGGLYSIIIQQDSVGGHELSLGSSYRVAESNFPKLAYQQYKFDFTYTGSHMLGNYTAFNARSDLAFLNKYRDSIEFAFIPHLVGGITTDNNGTYDRLLSIPDTVNLYTDLSRNVAKFITSSGVTPPILDKYEGRYCINFNGTDSYSRIRGSRSLRKFFEGDWTLYFQVNADDSEQDALFSSRSSSGQVGFTIRKNTTTGVLILEASRDGGTRPFDDVTTAFIHPDSSWQDVIIRARKDSMFVRIGDQVEDSFDYDSTGVDTDMVQDISIGLRGFAADLQFDGKFGNIIFFNTFLEDDQLNELTALNQDNIDFSPLAAIRDHKTFDPSVITGLSEWYQADSTTLFTTQSGSTNVSNTDGALRWESKVGESWKYASVGAPNAPAWQSNCVNGKGCLNWDTGPDYYTLNSATQLASSLGDYTVFISIKPNDTTSQRVLLYTNSTNSLGITSPNTLHYYGLEQRIHAYVDPIDSFKKGNLINGLAAKLEFNEWNILVFAKRGDSYFMSANGGTNYSRVDSVFVNNTFTNLGVNASTSFVGSMRHYLHYDHYLDISMQNKVLRYLAEDLGLSVPDIETDVDEKRITVYDEYDDPLYDYNSFVSAAMNGDTMFATWTRAQNHNNSLATTDGIVFSKISQSGEILFGPEQILTDSITENLNMQDSHIGMLGDTAIISYFNTTFQTSAVSHSWFMLRYPDGSYSTPDSIYLSIDPNFRVTSRIVRDESTGHWYTSGYSRSSPNYTARVIKSEDQGATWLPVLAVDGQNFFGGIDPEEPVLRQLSTGNWMLLIRDDVTEKIYSLITDDPDSWGSVSLSEVCNGRGKPSFVETDKRILVVSNRLPRSQSFKTTYVLSYDLGKSWSSPIEHDSYRAEVGGWYHEYGHPVDFGSGNVGIIWAAQDGQAKTSNISMIKLKLK